MPENCPVCNIRFYSYQNRLQCTTCFGLIHHGNRLECSNLTESEFEEHVNDVDKSLICDHCVSECISKNNNSAFQTLPFPVECDDDIFGKPPEVKRKPDMNFLVNVNTLKIRSNQFPMMKTRKNFSIPW